MKADSSLKYFLYIVTAFLVNNVDTHAQIDTAGARHTLPGDPVYDRQFFADPAGIADMPVIPFNRAQVAYNHEKGSLRLPQEAAQNRSIGFFTRGAVRVNRWQLYGSFDYKRLWADSMGWTQRLHHLDPNPYYLASQKPGNWEGERYRLTGFATYSLSPQWHAGGGLAYHVEDAARSNDPRPLYKKYRLHLLASIGWKSAKDVYIAAGGGYGYGTENTSVVYSNDVEHNIPTATEYIVYDFLGYGYYRFHIRKSMQSKTKWYEMYVRMHVPLAGGKLYSRLSYQVQKDSSFRHHGSGDQLHMPIGVFTLRSTRLQAWWTKTQSSPWSFGLQAALQDGKDYNHVLLNGFNYRYTSRSVSAIAASKRFKNLTNGREFSLQVAAHDMQKQDGNTTHDLYVSYITLQGNAQWHLPGKKENGWLLGIAPAAYLNTGAGLTVLPTQMNLFTRAVALPETQYYQTHQVGATVKAGYIHPLAGKGDQKYMVLSLAFGDMFAINAYQSPASSAYSFYPHGSRWKANVQLDFYF